MHVPRHLRWVALLGAIVALAACSADPTATPAPTATAPGTPVPWPAPPDGAVSVSLAASKDVTLYEDPGASSEKSTATRSYGPSIEW